MFVKPAEGRAARDPRSRVLLPAEGAEVPDHDSFWVRRVRDGDVVVVKTPEVQGEQPGPAEPAEEQKALPAPDHKEEHA